MEVTQALMDSLKGADVEVVYRNGDATIRRTLNNVSFKRSARGDILVVGWDPKISECRTKRVEDLEDIRLLKAAA